MPSYLIKTYLNDVKSIVFFLPQSIWFTLIPLSPFINTYLVYVKPTVLFKSALKSGQGYTVFFNYRPFDF